MADDTYMPLVYMMQGGDELVVASSGLVTIEDGGSLDLESGGGIDVQSGADITVESGGDINLNEGGDINVAFGGRVTFDVNGATSSGFNGSSTLSTQSAADGVTFICSSGSNYKIELPAPYLGAHKYIFNTAGSTGMVQYISAGSGVGIVTTGGDSTAHMMVNEGTTSGALSGWCHLVGLSATRWLRVAHSPTTQWVIVSTSS